MPLGETEGAHEPRGPKQTSVHGSQRERDWRGELESEEEIAQPGSSERTFPVVPAPCRGSREPGCSKKPKSRDEAGDRRLR